MNFVIYQKVKGKKPSWKIGSSFSLKRPLKGYHFALLIPKDCRPLRNTSSIQTISILANPATKNLRSRGDVVSKTIKKGSVIKQMCSLTLKSKMYYVLFNNIES